MVVGAGKIVKGASAVELYGGGHWSGVCAVRHCGISACSLAEHRRCLKRTTSSGRLISLCVLLLAPQATSPGNDRCAEKQKAMQWTWLPIMPVSWFLEKGDAGYSSYIFVGERTALAVL